MAVTKTKAAPAKGKSEPKDEGTFELTIQPAEEASQVPALRQQATTIQITDRESHERGLELLKGWKALRRSIEHHWKGIKQGVDQLKRNLLEQERRDVEPLSLAIEMLEGKCLSYAEAEKRRVAEALEAQRRQAEIDAAARRQKEMDEAEAKALKLEAESENLSARELWFVSKYCEMFEPTQTIGTGEKTMLAAVCKQAGFKDPGAAVNRLLNSEKILNAIGAKRQALEIRQQQIAKANAPLEVEEPLEKPREQTGYVAGMSTRTYVSCEVITPGTIVAAMAARGELEGLEPIQKYLNERAKALPRAQFEAAYPGARWLERKGIAG